MFARITKDLLWKPDGVYQDSRAGDVIISDVTEPHNALVLMKVRLLDDDRIPYYEAMATDDALEELFDWCQRDAGVTILQTIKDGVWVDTIS